MKTLLLLLFFIPVLSFSQSDTLTSLNRFYSETPGAMIKRQYIEVGRFKNGQVQLVKLTNQRTSKSSYFVKLDYAGRLGGGIAGAVTIDMDELPGIIDALEYINKVTQKDQSDNHEEYTYITKNNLQLTLNDGYGAYMKGWYIGLGEKYYLYDAYKQYRFMLLRPNEIEEAVPLLKKALQAQF